MTAYKVKGVDTKRFSLTTSDSEIATLKYASWVSYKAEIGFANNTIYNMKPKGFWGTTIELLQNEQVLLSYKMGWNGHIAITTFFDEQTTEFIFKQKGFLKSVFVLLDNNKQELLVVRPHFKWNRFSYDYTITTTDVFDDLTSSQILVAATIHCANYYTAMMAAVV